LRVPYATVQRAAASALRTLAFKNDENKNQIVECGALPMLIFMIRSEDQARLVIVSTSFIFSLSSVSREHL